MTTPPGQPPPYGPPPYGGQQYPPPPPPPYSAPPPGGYYYPPPQKPKSNRTKVLLIVLGVIVGVIVLVVGAIIALFLIVGKDTVTATDVKVGDCLKEIPSGTRVLTVQTTGCDEPHAGEVFAVLLMPDGDFPGQDAIDDYADKCGPELASYSPAAMEDDTIQMYVLYPTAETWAEGDRAVTCVATLDPPRTGTIKG
ncbi:septum formation family protein [Mycolicibacterium sp. XJ662]